MFGASLAAILVLVGFCWLLGFHDHPVLTDADQAERIADEALTGFHASAVGLDTSRAAALLRGTDGRVVLVRPVGDRWLVRVLGGGARLDGDRLTLPREIGSAPTTLTLPDAPRWAAWLA